ncbi:PHP domain-containing protein [Oryzomonas sagensis]|uniref:PHP domain-containing protein n=1 Tax=Oryzomonas sagensis TaxID=2603857 RepID=A0ABQ6TPY1_9BACT|nr:PHP domain-containing protein [Oryzomonas sagensis]KAB0670590.1 PHP domain-containing protein [Oryzomonas sagensis]
MTTEQTAYIDLHVHSCFSDGAFTPSQLVERAATEGLRAIAIADHDSVAGVPEGIAAGAERGLEVIPAIELSVQFKTYKDVHLLGYGMDWGDHGFLEQLSRLRERRELRSHDILAAVNERLAGEGRAVIGFEEVAIHARGAIGRPHIARAMIGRGYADSVEEAFRRYLVPCNVPKRYWPMDDAIATIRRLGGAAVLAHPTSVSILSPELRSIITELAELGLDGIEVFNNMAQPEEMAVLQRIAGDRGLLMTGGSDFHGIEEGQELGRGRNGIRFEDTLLTPLKTLIERRRRQADT